jgi:hypothetical protein|nr:MAG TPA: hypothetical protein [Bacteriophage sp.]
MLIKISKDKYIDPKKVEALVIVPIGGCYDVYVTTANNVGSYTVSKGHKTFEEAELFMNELVGKVNNAN